MRLPSLPASASSRAMRPIFGALVLCTQGLFAGAIISVNIDEAMGRRAMSPADVAGATAETRTSNWNNVRAEKNAPAPATPFIFSDGRPVPPAFSIDWELRPTWFAAPPDPLTNDAALFIGGAELLTGGSITLRGIPFRTYDLIVYVRTGHPGRGGAISVDGGETTLHVRGGSKALETGAEYIVARSRNYDPAAASLVEPANHVVFTALQGDSQTLQFDTLDMGNQFPRLIVCGFQIVER